MYESIDSPEKSIVFRQIFAFCKNSFFPYLEDLSNRLLNDSLCPVFVCRVNGYVVKGDSKAERRFGIRYTVFVPYVNLRYFKLDVLDYLSDKLLNKSLV